jgi:3-phosphoshikimate 1-carboxyvinyltransferase
MMNGVSVVSPSEVNVAIHLPASKSICNRALVIQALAKEKGQVSHLSDCTDTRVMVKALSEMPDTIDIAAAGTAMRFLTAYLSTCPSTHVLTGTARMRQRPIHILVDALRSLGARITYVENEGFPPLHIEGTTMHGGTLTLDGGVSSQFISALLLIAPTLEGGLTLQLRGTIVSRSYIDLTIRMMRDCGADVRWEGDDRVVVRPKPYRIQSYAVESDWSAASYWYETVALASSATVTLTDLHADSYQGDKRVKEVFALLGVRTDFTDEGVVLTKGGEKVKRLTDSFGDIPDMAQTVVVACCLLDVPFRIGGLRTLKIKETDRIAALEKELGKLGYVLLDEEEGDVLRWDGERCPRQPDALIETYDDHRMAMAFAPAALCMGEIHIAHPEVVSKSYVGYWDDLRKAGFEINKME